MLLKKISKSFLIAIYVIVIITQMIHFVPYKNIYLRLSDDGVSHSTITGNGYTSFFEIEKSFKVNDNDGSQAYCKTVDTPQLAINLTLTTIVAVAIYFLFIHKKEKTYQLIDEQEIKKLLPELDFNELAFADEETKVKAQKDYADAMYRYVISKINKE